MSIEQSLNPAPLGISSLVAEEEPTIEIEIDGLDGVDMEGFEIESFEDSEFGANLAEEMSNNELQSVANEIVELVDADINSRKDWVDMYVKGLEVLGMKYEERTEPWSGACGVFSTVLTEAAVRFQSETILETFPAQGPVKTEIIGAIDKLKEEAAERVREDMNYQLTEKMPEYRPEHEKMLYSLGLAGSAFKKVYYDSSIRRQVSMFIPAEDMIIPYGSSSLISSERVTHIMRKTPNEVRKLQVSGFYRDVDLGEPVAIHTDIEKKKAEDQGFSVTDDNRYQLLEVHIDYDLPGYEDEDGVALPYVITIDRNTNEVLSIRRNYEEDDENREKRQHFAQYTYIPGFGAYGIGLISLIGGYARAGTSLIRQLIDAGTLSNLPGGLKSRGLRIKGDDTPIAPGEFRDVDVPSGTVRDNIMALPYKEPSQVLASLLQTITDEGRRLGSIADMNISDMSANSPVGTTLAILERQLKNMSAVQARIHYSMKQEFRMLKSIIRDYTPTEYSYNPIGNNRKAKQSDYDLVEVIPVSDPNSSTMAQRIMQYQAVIQLAQGAPQIYDLPQLHRQMIEVLGVKNAEKLVPVEDDMTPRDPVSENMAFLTGKPTKAFIYQDHDAHIAVHTAMMQDPTLMAQIGQNPQAQKMMAEIQAHIAEHLSFAYRKKVEEQLGVPMPAPNAKLPEEVEVQLSRMVAQAAQQVLAQSKGQAQEQEAQKQSQDPIVQMQQAELEIKKTEAQAKIAKIQGDLEVKKQELQLKMQKANSPQANVAQSTAERQQLELQMMAKRHQQEMQQEAESHEQKMAIERQTAMQRNQINNRS